MGVCLGPFLARAIFSYSQNPRIPSIVESVESESAEFRRIFGISRIGGLHDYVESLEFVECVEFVELVALVEQERDEETLTRRREGGRRTIY